MKAYQRHQLKQNDFAATVSRLLTALQEYRDKILVAGLAVVVLGGVVGGYYYWHRHQNDQASALFGVAMSIYQAPIAPAPTVPGAKQAAGTYPTVEARQEAALKAFQQVASAYPSSPAGLAAAYHAAGALAALGRFPDAEKAYEDVASRAGSSLYGPMAQLGEADALASEGKYDQAISWYSDLSARRDGMLPVDGVLMNLAQTYEKAGKTSEASATYKRVVDEFPDSTYVSGAQQQIATLGGNS